MKKEWIELYNGDVLIAKQVSDNFMELVDNSVELPFGLFPEKRVGELIDILIFNMWLEERIFPRERLGVEDLLKEANLQEYDTWKLLKLTGGKLMQDKFHVKWVK